METKGKTRKHYKRPQVSRVKLEIEEAVLTACKSLAGFAKNKTPCKIGTGGGDCKTAYGS